MTQDAVLRGCDEVLLGEQFQAFERTAVLSCLGSSSPRRTIMILGNVGNDSQNNTASQQEDLNFHGDNDANQKSCAWSCHKVSSCLWH
jgi:hypothetical protein